MIPYFNRKQFLETIEPYEWLFENSKSEIELLQNSEKLKAQARDIGVSVSDFQKLLKAYKMSKMNSKENETQFSGQEVKLNSGKYICDDNGIRLPNGTDDIEVCSHPILPVKRLINVDDDTCKIEVDYRNRGKWRRAIVEKSILSSSAKILELAQYDISVTSSNAKRLVDYFQFVLDHNDEKIKDVTSVTRLGWITQSEFAPYADTLEYDGDENYQQLYESVTAAGDYNTWLDAMRRMRSSTSVAPRVVLAASFASVLLELKSQIPFFVHIWGATGCGKTVALMLASSVWANPDVNAGFIQSFNSTSVALGLGAAFRNSLPYAIDELQIIADKKTSNDSMIYSLAEGISRAKGKKDGGLQRQNKWRNCILTTGEFPLTSYNSGGGALNRVIEINCSEGKFFANPGELVNTIKSNYGHAGQRWIQVLQDESVRTAVDELYSAYYQELCARGVTEKQSAAAAILLTADTLVAEFIFEDAKILEVGDLIPFLRSEADVDQNRKAYEFINDFYYANRVLFNGDDMHTGTCGAADEDYVYFLPSRLDVILRENGFNSNAFLRWARTKGLLKVDGDRLQYTHTFEGRSVRVNSIKLADEKQPKSEEPTPMSAPAKEIMLDRYGADAIDELPF